MRSGSNVAALAITRAIFTKNGIATPQVVARPANSIRPVTTLTNRLIATARKTQRKADNGMFLADAEQAEVELPARTDQHPHAHGV